MKLDFRNDRILAVVAHPDDAELLCAGTLARAKGEGAEVAVCVMCQGDKGQASRMVANLKAVRRKEMATSARLLGGRLFFGDVPDGTLSDDTRSRFRLVEVFRQFRPTLVFAHAPRDYHPDHRSASALAAAASWFCASRGHESKSPALGSQPALWWMDTMDMNGFVPGFYVDVTKTLDLKRRMLACHQSQLRRGKDSDFSSLEELMLSLSRARGMQGGVAAAEAFSQELVFKRARAW